MFAEPLPERGVDARLPAGAACLRPREHLRLETDCCRDFGRLEFWTAPGERGLLKARDPVGVAHIRNDIVVIFPIV